MKPQQTLSLGFSPCPNDTFIFHALVHDEVRVPGVDFEPHLEDVETLNRLALNAELDVTKVSFGALPYLLGDYRLLRSGGALGNGCGPLVVARDPIADDRLRSLRLAIPGKLTTANLLWRLYAPDAPPGVELTYDRIMPAVEAGEVDAGLIIHESRFTYPEHGLEKLIDLGDWWERTTDSPIPLGAIVGRRALGPRLDEIERAIRDSVEYAFANPSASRQYVRQHAQEMSDEVTRSHIDLYVNRFSVELGADGERAVRSLMEKAAGAGIIPRDARDPFPDLSTM